MNHIIYDIESFPNIFTLAAGDPAKRFKIDFEISSRKNELEQLIKFLSQVKKKNTSMVGFRNIDYDYPVLHFLMTNVTRESFALPGQVVCKSIFDFSDALIKSKSKFTSVKHDEVIIPQIDLYKIHHFDNAHRGTSLKEIEFKMRAKRLSDLPCPPGEDVPESMMDDLLGYNHDDVENTIDFYNESLVLVRKRNDKIEEFGQQVMNYSESKLGLEFMVKRLEAELGPDICYTTNSRGTRKARQTVRDEVALADVIIDEIKFEDPGLKAVLSILKGRVITQTKEALDNVDLLDPASEGMLGYVDEIQEKILEIEQIKKEAHPDGKASEKKISKMTEIVHLPTGEVLYTYRNAGSAVKIDKIRSQYPDEELEHRVIKHAMPKLAVVFRETMFVFGTGGLHGSLIRSEIHSDNDWVIIDSDVKGYYPKLIKSLGIYPEHIGPQFVNVISQLIDIREKFAPGTEENVKAKLEANSVFGNLIAQFSCLFDPAAGMKVTLNGQLLVMMLIEKLSIKLGDDIKFIQANTDGFTVKVKRDRGAEFSQVCNQWCSDTKLELEYGAYQSMFIKSVNSYLAIKPNGELKQVGDYKDPRNDWAKNWGEMVVYKTAVAYLTGETKDIRAYLEDYEDVYHFSFFVKATKTTEFMGLYSETNNPDSLVRKVQRRSRFIVSNEGDYLFKQQKNLNSVKKGKRVLEINDLPDDLESLRDLIDFDYYEDEVKKLIKFNKYED